MKKLQKFKLYLLLVTFILNIDFADAKNGKWKPGNENYRRFPLDRTLQNDRIIPTGKTIQNDRKLQMDEKMQNDRGTSNDRVLQNDRRIPTSRTRTIQNDRIIQIDGKMQNDRIMQYNKSVHSARTYQPDGIMQEDRRKRINRILENDRLSENELQRKIDSLSQNKNMHNDKRVQDGRRMPSVRTQNDRKTQTDLKVQNTRRILDERNQKMINARRMRYDKSMWAATPHHIARPRQGDWAASVHRIARSFGNDSSNSSNVVSDDPEDDGKSQGWGNFWNTMFAAMQQIHSGRPEINHYLTIRACHIIATTYISALSDYKRYYTLRNFYENNLAYEVGYLVSEIISKYQRMLELYDLATEYFFKHLNKQYAPSTYILYVYTNILEMGTVISHLCNMLNEMEDKYKYIPVPKSGFADYHLDKKTKSYDAEFEKISARVAEYEKALARMKRTKQKERKKKRAKDLNLDMVVTTPSRKQHRGNFPINYGWSIEYYW